MTVQVILCHFKLDSWLSFRITESFIHWLAYYEYYSVGRQLVLLGLIYFVRKATCNCLWKLKIALKLCQLLAFTMSYACSSADSWSLSALFLLQIDSFCSIFSWPEWKWKELFDTLAKVAKNISLLLLHGKVHDPNPLIWTKFTSLKFHIFINFPSKFIMLWVLLREILLSDTHSICYHGEIRNIPVI